eukprot:TRINITY_DN12007_c6_g1_i6.p1 TRINITY_DN12007_c6_g1~~TRINITY_DN12007_c6_g1_i6.p1  ORF type:complete len:403 (+),score=92.93 TRINITY_DN12007_c6_g1_i6:1275-2483(+)
MSFRELRDFTEMLRALGYPRMVSIDNFRQPNFPLVAEILLWLVKKFDANEMVPTDIEEQSDRIIFIKAMASFMAMKAHVKLSTKQLYKADGYAVRELLKITSLLYNADKQSKSQHDQGAVPVSLSDFDINTKLGDLKQTRMLANEITTRGAKLHELLGSEPELRAARQMVLSQGMDIDQIEGAVKHSLKVVRAQTDKINTMMNNLASDEANLEAKLDKKRADVDRKHKRLKSLQSVRPVFMDEYEKLEAEMQRQYEAYIEKFRNLSFLERELEIHNQREQDKFEETERQLRRMQERLRDEELRLIRGGEDGALDMDDEDDYDDRDDVLHDGQFSDSDDELAQEPRYQRPGGGRQAAAYGDMGADLDDEDSELDSDITDNAEDDMLAYGDDDDDLFNDTDDDF